MSIFLVLEERRITTGSPLSETRRHIAVFLGDEQLRCPAGHAIAKHYWILGSEPIGGVRCTFRLPPNHAMCGAAMVVLPAEGSLRLLVEVTSAELHDMEQRRMSLRDIRDFLGLAWRKGV